MSAVEAKAIEIKKETPKVPEPVIFAPAVKPVKEETNSEILSTSTQDIPLKKNDKSGKKSPELESKSELEVDEQVDMSGTFLNINNINTSIPSKE